MIGKKLAHYEILEKIGAGGMGEVYRAHDTKLDREVALKVLPADMARDPQRLERFEREAKAVAALKHPNIVTIHSVEEADGLRFLTMELVEGKSLSNILPKEGLPLDRLFEIAIPLADAVSSAHAKGITHRDLKPDNIMIDGEGRLRVLDFGLAKLQDPQGLGASTQATTAAAVTEEGKILGTVAYMSPEQAEGKTVDSRSDIFSLGTILYEMATGTRPFQGDTTISTIGSILKDEPASVTELNGSLPRHAGRIIRRCLAKHPDRRYQTALDLRNELEELKAEIESGDVEAETHIAARPTRRLRPLLFLGVGAVVAAVVIFAIKPWKQSDSPAPIYTSRPLTATIAWDQDPNWSPEGEFIAFGRMTSGSMDVYVKPVAGGEAVVRAGGPADETTPRWSPDGKYLAYVSGSEPGTFVFLVPPHGGEPRKLIETNIPRLALRRVHQAMGDRPWSQDGRTLLVSRVSSSGRMAIFRVDRDNGSSDQLTFPPAGSNDVRASHSFDGDRIAFVREINSRGTLMTMPSTGGSPEELLADQFTNGKPAWRPDNRHIVFESTCGGSNENLWEIDVITGSKRQLTFETKSVQGFSVSSDDRIAYSPFWHDTFLFTVDVETGEHRQLTSHTKDNYGARFSPDGETVAYHSTRTGNSEIWLCHLNGRPETQVTDHPAWDLYPEWSPDGRRMLFVSDRDGGPVKIFIANRDGGNVQLLVDQPISFPTQAPVNRTLIARWSPDGEEIAYLVAGDETESLWTIGPDGEGARRRLDHVTGFDWYRSNHHAVITRRRGSEEEMIAVDLETGQEQTLFVGALTEFDVAPDGSAVAFCFGRGHTTMGLALLRLELPSDSDGLPRANGEPEYLARSEGTWHVHNGGWSPDSRSLVYTQDTDYGDIFELEIQ
jgi:serine/threonine protein kinase/WD40 repeat protein